MNRPTTYRTHNCLPPGCSIATGLGSCLRHRRRLLPSPSSPLRPYSTSPTSDKTRLRTVRHRGRLQFQIFNGRMTKEGPTASPCHIWSKSVKLRPKYDIFLILQRWLLCDILKICFVGDLIQAVRDRSIKHHTNQSGASGTCSYN